jgi:hypothetical protein
MLSLLKISPFARLTEMVVCPCLGRKTTSLFSPEKLPIIGGELILAIVLSCIIVREKGRHNPPLQSGFFP